jgi:hypothetical protein
VYKRRSLKLYCSTRKSSPFIPAWSATAATDSPRYFFVCPAGVRPVIVLCIEPLADRLPDLAELEEDLE